MLQTKAKARLHENWMSPTRDEADHVVDAFVQTYRTKCPKATEKPTKDRDTLLTFYGFLSKHWIYATDF